MAISLKAGDKIQLKSWKGDYLHRPDSSQGVTTWYTGIGNEWEVELKDDGKVTLKSWKGDGLHRPNSNQGVTTWHTGVGNEWTVEEVEDGTVMLKSWKGDYLHRPDSNQGVTTWHTGIGNHWTLEAVEGYTIEEDVEVEDLSKIEGIGPKIFALLQAAGIKSYAQLAEASKEDLDTILDEAGRSYAMADPTTWMEQSALAAAGKWDELKALQDELIGGRRK